MFYEQRFKIFSAILFVLGLVIGIMQPWSFLSKESLELTYLVEEAYVIEDTLSITAYVIHDRTETSLDSSLFSANAYINDKDETTVKAETTTYDDIKNQVSTTFDMSIVEEANDFVVMFEYDGTEYGLTIKQDTLLEFTTSRFVMTQDSKLNTVVFKKQKNVEIDQYNTIQESIQGTTTVRFRVNEYVYNKENNTASVSVTTAKNGSTILVGFTDENDAILDYYTTSMLWNNDYQKNTYQINLNDDSTKVTAFVRVVSSGQNAKDVPSFTITFDGTSQQQKNKL